MAEYAFNQLQTVEDNDPIILNTVIPCNKGYVYHREESGILVLRCNANCPTCFARFQVTFNGNIAVPTGGTVGPISVALTIDGEAIGTSRAIVTPAAVEQFFNVTSTAIITVPKGCCMNVSVENASGADIEVQNANLTISRIA